MSANPTPASSSEGAIRETAYHLWEQSGRPHGRDIEFWDRAIALLAAAPAAPARARAKAAAKPAAARTVSISGKVAPTGKRAAAPKARKPRASVKA